MTLHGPNTSYLIMAVGMSSFLLMALHFWLVNGSVRREKTLYRPYGPNMCRELCRKSNDTFLFTTRFLSCRRFLWNHSDHKIVCPTTDSFICSTTDSFICSKGTKTRGIKYVTVAPGRNSLTRDDKGSQKDDIIDSHILQTTEKNSTGEKDFVKNSYITLHKACKEGNLEAVKFSLSHGGQDINCRDKLNRTPVMTAARYGRLAVFDFLVSRGCDMSLLSSHDINVLHVACGGGHVGIVEKIITSGIFDIDVRAFCGRTPLMFAVKYSQRRVFDLLRNRGCNMFSIDNNGNNVLHIACIDCKLDMVEIIMSNNSVNINRREALGRTPVMLAAVKGCIHVVKLLISKGCNLNIKDKYGHNILHVACHGGYVEIVEYILGKKIFGTESRGYLERTAVMIAASKGYIKLVEFLVGKKCDLSVLDTNKETVLHRACIGGSIDVVKYILSRDVIDMDSRGRFQVTPIMIAAVHGHVEVMDLLVSRGCNVNAIDQSRRNILHLACTKGQVHIVKYIFKHNLIGIESRQQSGRTPVMIALARGRRDVIHILIREGCDLQAKDFNRNTILHVACEGGGLDIVKYLISLGVTDVKARNIDGYTPVKVAQLRGHDAVFKFLKSRAKAVM